MIAAPTEDGGTADRDLPADIAPLVREMLRNLDIPHGISDAIRVDWSPDTLSSPLRAELRGAEVIVVSNREPYIHNQEGDTVRVQRPASGLATALEPVVHACGGTWIAHGSGSADAQNVDRKDRTQIRPRAPAYTLPRIWLSKEEQEGYTYGLPNHGLWPLCQIVFVRPNFRASLDRPLLGVPD